MITTDREPVAAYAPSLALLRDRVAASIRRATAETIKRSSAPATVFRLWLEHEGGAGPSTLVAKRIEQDWPGDPKGHQREVSFYQRLLPSLVVPHPHVYYAGPEPGTTAQLVILEDVAGSYRFPTPEHRWTQTEAETILDAYARLHASGLNLVPTLEKRDWLMARHEKRLLETAADLPAMVEALTENRVWPRIDNFTTLLDTTLGSTKMAADAPVTIIHNDVYTPNCGLPRSGEGQAILVDWDMVGWGLAELDLAFMFLQPFGSHRNLDRQSALAYYWRRRESIEGQQPPADEREARQRYAEALWALWLVPTAYRMMISPPPPDSSPGTYWKAMFTELGNRLQVLARET